MENLVSPEIVNSVVGGAILTILVQILKKPLSKYSPRLVVAILALLSGGLYYGFYTYVPEMLKQEMIDFIYGTLSSAVFIYAFIWKGIQERYAGKPKKKK